MVAVKEQPAAVRDGIATMKEAMRFLSRSRSHVENLIESEEIVGVKDGRLWAIDWPSLYAYKDRLFSKRRRRAS
jgi:hypothetical protein